MLMASYKVLDMEVGDDDALYRLQRLFDGASSVVYVLVEDIQIIPMDARTSPDELLREFRTFRDWHSAEWTTLKLSSSPQGRIFTTDSFEPHSLCPGFGKGFEDLLQFDWADLTTSRVKLRVHEVQKDGETYFLKLARFEHELQFLEAELDAYRILATKGSGVTPTLKGFVHEGSPGRTIGILLQKLEGHTPTFSDLQNCLDTLEDFHRTGLCHGDINRTNFIVSGGKAYIIDFECSYLDKDDGMAKDRKAVLEALDPDYDLP